MTKITKSQKRNAFVIVLVILHDIVFIVTGQSRFAAVFYIHGAHMNARKLSNAGILLLALGSGFGLTACGFGGSSAASAVPTNSQSSSGRVSTTAIVVARKNFVGAFVRAEGSPPYGIFSPQSSQIEPVPYPTPGSTMTGPKGYCDEIAANGTSIDGSFVVDSTKLKDLIYLGARWSRLAASQFFIDGTHIFGAYAWGTLDAAQCVSQIDHNIQPVIGIVAGPVMYDAVPDLFTPVSVPTYQSPNDFGQWCSAVAQHERNVFPTVSKFSIPGNEVNSNPQLFPGGESQIAAFTRSCYKAIKTVNPNYYVYGFELNMDGGLNTPKFVRDLVSLGCGPGTCYDGLAIHLSLRYPTRSASTPCYPNPGGDYTMQCVSDIESASGSAIHVLISETVYLVPGSVPDEQTKASAIVSEYQAFSQNSTIDGVLYANIDECGVYVGTEFSGGCLIDTSGNQLPGFSALQWLAGQSFI